MLKLKKTIVNSNGSLIGFIVEGKEKELGGFSNNVIERGVPTDVLVKQNFNNNQICIKDSKILEKGSFKINQLPMTYYENNQYTDIDNKIYIVKRYIMNNKNIGFRIRFSNDSEDNFKYENVIMLTRWFRPGNFSLRTSSKGLYYICGKNGVSLDSIPFEIIGSAPVKPAKRLKSQGVTPPGKNISGNIENDIDILDLFDTVKELGGCPIKLPSTSYETTSDYMSETPDEFTSLNIGEVGSKELVFNPKKLNASCNFKKVGVVNISIGNNDNKVLTYVNRLKNIFSNGEAHLKEFAVAVPIDKSAELVNRIGGSVVISNINDSNITGPLSQIIDAKNLKFFKVDANKLNLISSNKIDKSILSSSKLVELCKMQYNMKLIEKALGYKGGLLGELKKTMSKEDIATAVSKSIASSLSMYSADALKAIQEAGIDIYSGSYTKVGTVSKKPGSTSKGDSDIDDVEIEYILKGYDASKITGSKILKAVEDNDTSILSGNVIKEIKNVLALNDDKAKFALAKKMYDSAYMRSQEINKKLWLHNSSMYILGNKKKIHTSDASSWELDTTSRVRNGQVYRCKEAGCTDLTVKVKGIEI